MVLGVYAYQGVYVLISQYEIWSKRYFGSFMVWMLSCWEEPANLFNVGKQFSVDVADAPVSHEVIVKFGHSG